MLGSYSLFDKVGYPIGQHPCLAGSGTGDDHHGTIGVGDGLALNFIEGLEVTHRQKAKIEDMIMLEGKKNASNWNCVILAPL